MSRPSLRAPSLRTVLVVAIVLVLAGAIAGVGVLRHARDHYVTAHFTSTVGLYKGSDVRILGVPVGKVVSVRPNSRDVVVRMRIDGDQRVAADTGAVVIAPSLVSDRYVQLTEPWVRGAELGDGAVIPVKRTATPVELDQLYTSVKQISDALGPNGANKNGALSDLLDTGAANLKGNGAAINTLLRNFGEATGTLSRADEDLFATVRNFKSFNDVLVANDKGVSQVNDQLADVTGYLAADRGDLAAALRNLSRALAVVDDFIRENRGHLRSSISKLTGTTQTLNRQKASLAEMVRVLPVTLQNFINAYDADHNTLDGRGNLNEVGLYGGAKDAGGVGSRSRGDQGQGGQSGPPLLLPSVGDDR